MTAALRINAICCSVPERSSSSHPPINFFYSHFHNSIRNELDALSQAGSTLASAAQEDVHESLSTLKSRYRFLEQVYKYHSSVEDEVRPVILLKDHSNISLLRSWQDRRRVIRSEGKSHVMSVIVPYACR